MKHEVFELVGEEMQLFDCYPFTIITDCDGTELVYIRRQISDDSKCDVIYCGGCIYQYAKWTKHALEQWVNSYCTNVLGRCVCSAQYSPHLILPQLGISDFSYGVNHLKKLEF